VIISPGGGRLGSCSWRFIRTAERRLPGCEGCRFRAEVLDDPVQSSKSVKKVGRFRVELGIRRMALESSCCKPAFTVAAAWSEFVAVRGEGDGLWPRKAVAVAVAVAVASPGFDIARDMAEDEDLDGGREFKSGAIALGFMDWDRVGGVRYRQEKGEREWKVSGRDTRNRSG